MAPLTTFLRCVVVRILAACLVLGIPVAVAVAPATPAVSVSANPASVAAGGSTTITAGMPVSDAGTVSQEIIQTVDPTKMVMSSSADVTAPVGWGIQYFNGSSWSGTAPGNAAGWAQITQVKASGNVVSEGASGTGKQVASRTTTGVLATVGSSLAAAGSGDGWDVFFDPGYTRVFNRPHHQDDVGSEGLKLDCHWLAAGPGHAAGSACWNYSGSSVFQMAGQGFTDSDRATGWIDGQNRLWLEMEKKSAGSTGYGFACLDVSGATPVACASGLWNLLEPRASFDITPGYDEAMDIAHIGGKVFTQTNTGAVLCLDTLAVGGPAACPGQPYTYALGMPSGYYSFGARGSDVSVIGGKLYYLASSDNLTGVLTCIDPAKIVAGATKNSIVCDGWPGTPPSIGGGPIITAPNASGVPVAACGVYGSICVNLQNGTTTVPGLPSALATSLNANRSGAYGQYRRFSGAATGGTRVYWPSGSAIYCFDAATNALCSGGGWPASELEVYAVRTDPINPKCLWSNSNQGWIRVRDGVTGALGCTSVSPVVSFPANLSMPRMGCSSNSAIQEWVSFRIPGTGSPDMLWSAATLSVLDPAKGPVPGWQDVVIPANGLLSLATLPVTGTTAGGATWVAGDLEFRVTFTDPTYAAAPQATIKAIGDAPQLCITATAPVNCPAASPGPIPAPNNSATMVALGDGSATDASSNTTNLIQGTTTVSIAAPTIAQCSGTISGQALDTSPTPRPVQGAVVALYDSSGNAVVYPAGHAQAGQPVTTTTDASGNYTFSGLAPAGYKARFVDTATVSAVSTTVATGGSGTVNAASGAMTSNTSTVAAGGTGTINARFTIASSTTADTSTGAQGATQSISPLANDTPLSGGTFTASSARLCTTATANGSCTATSLDMPGEGRYTVTNGVVSFVPCSAAATPIASCTGPFTGPATPIKYVVTDSGAHVVSSTIAPTVVAAPVATNNTSSGPYDTNQTITVLANDAAGTGATLTPSTVKLCPNPPPGTPTAANCNLTTLTTADGTYTANANGTVTFDPLPSFSGTATVQVRYVVQDSVSQLASALVTPSVTPPTAPSATPETKSVIPGATATFSNLITGGSALATGTGLQTGNTGGPCLVDPADSICKATFLIAGEGTWSVNRTTGVATFQALANATSGTKTPVSYRVTDAVGQSATSILTPVIPAAPTAGPNTSIGVVDANQVISLLANDTADPSTSLVASTVRICATGTAASSCTGTTLTNADGTYTANADGTVTFDPLPTFTGHATPIEYVVQDALGQRATSTITPEVVAIPAPTASPDATTGLPAQSQAVLPVINDSAGSATYPLDPASVRLCAGNDVAPACTHTTLTNSDGTYTVAPLTGEITFQPVANFIGTAQAVTYSVADGAAQRTSTTYTPTVVGIGPPQVAPSTVSVAYATPGQMTPQITPGTAPINTAKSCLAAPGASSCQPGATSITLPEGTYTLDPASGVVTFTPATGFTGTPANPPSMCVTDTAGQSACGLLTPTVAPPPAPPVTDQGASMPGAPAPSALPNTESTQKGQPVTIVVLADDAASSGAMLDPSSLQIKDPATGKWATSVTIPGQGTYRANPDGTITFMPLPGFVGTASAVSYRVSDSLGKSATSTASVIVHDTPPPWADPLFGQAMRGQPVIFDPVAANTAGTSPFVPSSVRIKDPATGKWATTVVIAGEGTWKVDPATGKVTFQPLKDFIGAATPLAYRLTTKAGKSVSSTLNPVIRTQAPSLEIRTTTSRATLRPGQKATITLKITNAGMATTKGTITRAPIPKGFAVANPMGGTVRGGYIFFATGNLASGRSTSRRFVLVATRQGVGQGSQQLTGRATATNTRAAKDPTALRVIGSVTGKAAVTG